MLFVGILAVILRWVLIHENRKATQGVGGGEYAGIPLEEGQVASVGREKFVFML